MTMLIGMVRENGEVKHVFRDREYWNPEIYQIDDKPFNNIVYKNIFDQIFLWN